MPNQDPEQKARNSKIDKQLIVSGWTIQDKDKINLNASAGVAVRYYLKQYGKETDYLMFLGKKPADDLGGRGEMFQLFSDKINNAINELNGILAA